MICASGVSVVSLDWARDSGLIWSISPKSKSLSDDVPSKGGGYICDPSKKGRRFDRERFVVFANQSRDGPSTFSTCHFHTNFGIEKRVMYPEQNK
jgi:hypothetical protein